MKNFKSLFLGVVLFSGIGQLIIAAATKQKAVGASAVKTSREPGSESPSEKKAKEAKRYAEDAKNLAMQAEKTAKQAQADLDKAKMLLDESKQMRSDEEAAAAKVSGQATGKIKAGATTVATNVETKTGGKVKAGATTAATNVEAKTGGVGIEAIDQDVATLQAAKGAEVSTKASIAEPAAQTIETNQTAKSTQNQATKTTFEENQAA